MALTGVGLVGFVVLHMIGNLQVFLGPEPINAYGHFLQSTPELIWPARVVLLAMVLIHIWAAIKLSAENRAARPVTYRNYKVVAASYASRTMFLSGLLIAAFIVFHILHFTVQTPAINFTGKDFTTLYDAARRHDIYQMMVLGFSNAGVSVFYIVSMSLLSLHLSHGIGSMFQSFGFKNKKFGACIDRTALIVAGILMVGYASIPVAVLAGILKPQP